MAATIITSSSFCTVFGLHLGQWRPVKGFLPSVVRLDFRVRDVTLEVNAEQ